MKTPDVLISGSGTIYSFTLFSGRARKWVNKYVSDPLYSSESTLLVDGRYACDLALAMIKDRLRVQKLDHDSDRSYTLGIKDEDVAPSTR